MISEGEGPFRSSRSLHPGGTPGSGKEALILIGQVDRPWGLAGEVIVTVHADDPARMAELSSIFMLFPDGSRRETRIEGYKRLGGRAVLKLAGFDTVEQARGMVGKELFIPAGASTPPPEGRYYAYQLLGLSARLPDGREIGVVREVLRQGSQSLLVLQGPSGEVLVPAVKEICVEFDLEAGIVTLDPPEGLIELNADARKD